MNKVKPHKTQEKSLDSLDMVTTSQISSSNSSLFSQPSLSKILKRLPKKRQKAKKNSLPIIANVWSPPSEGYPIIDPLFLPSFEEKGRDKQTRWAVIWLSRLQAPKKKSG